jgi:D-beta-D-heptose 7-phosphate kinase / D-beta-D-heptose 1-phosphate adenosyltransferase
MINLLNKSPKLLVVGDLMVDQYFWGSCDRISPEAPVPVINIDSETSVLGGAGNVVNNLIGLGAKVDVISVIGDCKISNELTNLLSDIGVRTEFLIVQKNRISSKKSRIVASQQQVIRYDRENTNEISLKAQEKVIKSFKKIVNDYEVILFSDYGKGLFTNYLTQSLISIAKEFNKKVLIDPKGSDYLKYKGAYLLTPNKKEASEATKINISTNDSLREAIIKLKSLCDLDISLITLSENGVAVYDDQLRTHPTTAKEVFDVTGAGDTILASLGFAVACGYEIDQAVEFSNLAAGVIVGKIGSAATSINEIIEYQSSLNKSSSDKHIKTWDEISAIVSELRNKDKKIIFTNGCFDILHIGHVKYLEKSKGFGDILILGLNSDKSVREIKGDTRPINSQDDRAYILASLEVVDYLVIFEQNTPLELIKMIKPDVLVKGCDYEGKKVVGENIAKELKLVEYIPGKSTTITIDKIINK